MILRRHKCHEVFFDNILMLTHSSLHIGVDNTLLDHILLNGMIDNLRVVLRADATQRRFLSLRNPQTVKRIFDILRNFFPASRHLGIRLDISDNIIHMEFLKARPPARQLKGIVDRQRVQAKIQHPLRFMLTHRNVADYLLCKSAMGFVD